MKNASRKSDKRKGNNKGGSRPASSRAVAADFSAADASTEKEAARAKAARTRAKLNNKNKVQAQTAGDDPAQDEAVYQVRTKRDSGILKAYITFTYRVLHPGVTTRLIYIGILIALPSIIIKQTWLRVTCLVIGLLLILLGLFRQYISLALTKKNDADYKSGVEFTYDFAANDASFYKGDELVSYISKYKDIASFFYDDKYYYIRMISGDFIILPKDRFTIGDPDKFEDFIYKKCKKTCRWVPSSFKDRMAKRRAARAISQKKS